jgi:aquaporin Z
MGLTMMAIVYSPWGQRSGAHLNPSLTLTFFRLGKIEPWDAVFYIIAQFSGGIIGVVLAAAVLGQLLAHPSVNYVVTVPGQFGLMVAFGAEVAITFILMTMVLTVSNTHRLARFTGLFAGLLVASYISLEAPLSGMSLNPARTFGSAVSAQVWTALWIYFTAPLLGMLSAAQLYLWRKGAQRVICAKLHHHNNQRCIFRCGYRQAEMNGQSLAASGS